MKIKSVSILFSLLLLSSFNMNVFAKDEHKIEYPYRKTFGLEKFYPEDLSAVYPFLNVSYARRKLPFRTINDEEGKLGLEYQQDGKIVQSVPYKYEELSACKVNGYGMFFHAIEGEREKIIDFLDNTIAYSDKFKLNCDDNQYPGSILIDRGDGRKGIILFNGNLILSPKYDTIYTQRDISAPGRRFYIAQMGDLYGVVDFDGNLIIPPSDEKIEPLGHFFFKTSNGGRFGVKDIYNNVIWDNKFFALEYVDRVYRQFIRACDESGCGILGLDGTVELKFSDNYSFSEMTKIQDGYFSVKFNDNPQGYAVVDSDGNMISKDYYDFISDNHRNDNVFIVSKDKKDKTLTGVIDINGNYIIPLSELGGLEPTGSNVFIASKTINHKSVEKPTKSYFTNSVYYKNKRLIKPIRALIKYSYGHLIIPNKPDKWYQKTVNEGAKVPAIDKNGVSYYILTPEELIKTNGFLLFQKLYDAETIKYEEDCFSISEKTNIFTKLRNKIMKKQPKRVKFCNPQR